MNVIAKGQLQAKRHAAGAAADAARQVDVQRMIGIHHAALSGKLCLQALARHRVAQNRVREFSSSMKKQFGSLSAALRPCSTATP